MSNLAEVPVGLGLAAVFLGVRGIPLVRSISRGGIGIDVMVSASFVFLLPFIFLAIARQHCVAHSWYVADVLFPTFAIFFSATLAKMPGKALDN